MLGTTRQPDLGSDLAAWAGRDRAAKVAAAAATIAHGWDKLDSRELSRLAEALDDHARGFLDWISTLPGPDVQDIRAVLSTMLTANRLLAQTTDRPTRAHLAGMLARSVTALVTAVNRAAQDITIDLQ